MGKAQIFSRDWINLQCVINFNILLLFIISFMTVGLWTCLKEIDKLKKTSEDMLSSFPNVLIKNKANLLRLSASTNNKMYYRLNEPLGHVRHFKKRDTASTHRAFDPLSMSPKDIQTYCRTIYNSCRDFRTGEAMTGPPGLPGMPGMKGEQGRPGPIGTPGLDGKKGHKGEKGDTGRSGEPGTDGPQGPPGWWSSPGVNGVQGTDGRRGKRGLQGMPGRPGKPGQDGVPGSKGEKGDIGDPGGMVNSDGQNCTCYGMQGFPGTTGPPGDKGEKGDPGFCKVSQVTNCGDKFVKKTEDLGTPEALRPTPKVTTKPTTTTAATTTTETTTVLTIPPRLTPRTIVCRVKQIGTPVFLRREHTVFGSILGDPVQPHKIWLSNDYHGQYLEEYKSMETLKSRAPDIRYNLRYNRYFGTQHAIYNNSFYYHFIGKQHIVRYDLSIHDVTTAVMISGSNFNNSNFLYKDSMTYYDIAADENGLWIVYGKPKNSSFSQMYVMKLDIDTMEIHRIWKLPFQTGKYTNGFIACGILYLINDFKAGTTETNITVTYDFYHDSINDVNITLKIPFAMNMMLTFFPNSVQRRNSLLLAWNNENIMKYPLLF